LLITGICVPFCNIIIFYELYCLRINTIIIINPKQTTLTKLLFHCFSVLIRTKYTMVSVFLILAKMKQKYIFFTLFFSIKKWSKNKDTCECCHLTILEFGYKHWQICVFVCSTFGRIKHTENYDCFTLSFLFGLKHWLLWAFLFIYLWKQRHLWVLSFNYFIYNVSGE
jgi:hypothetical protein